MHGREASTSLQRVVGRATQEFWVNFAKNDGNNREKRGKAYQGSGNSTPASAMMCCIGLGGGEATTTHHCHFISQKKSEEKSKNLKVRETMDA